MTSMIQTRILKSGEPQADHLEQFKQYASVPDDSRDGILQKMLKRAMLAVQEHSDTAILPCKFELVVTDVKAGETIRLYQGGKTVISVVDQNGEPVEYTQEENRIRVRRNYETVVVVYENEVCIPDAEALQPVIWQLATAIYDGEDPKVQASILKTTYGI